MPVWWCHVPRENQVTDKHYHTTIPHSKLKDRLRDLVQISFIKKNGQRRYKYLVLGRDRSYFVKKTLILPKSSLKLISSTCSSFWLTTYLLCLVDVFFNRQSAYIWLQTVLLFSLICSFIRMRQTSYRGWSFKFTFHYIDDVLSLKHSRFVDCVDCVDRIYPIELEIKDHTDTYISASYLDIDSEGWLKTKLYDKRNDFNFTIVNFH